MDYILYDNDKRYAGSVGIEPNHSNWTSVPYVGGLIREVFNEETNSWIESATQQEIAEINTPIYEQKIIDLFTYLMNRALSSSMGKYGSYEYLQIQKAEYDKKYQVAKGLAVNIPVANAIQKEMERDFPVPVLDDILTSYGYTDLSGSQIEKMYILIIIRYEYANGKLNTYEGMAIDFRTKCRTLVELAQWSKLDTAFSLVMNLPNELEESDISNYYNQFDAL